MSPGKEFILPSGKKEIKLSIKTKFSINTGSFLLKRLFKYKVVM